MYGTYYTLVTRRLMYDTYDRLAHRGLVHNRELINEACGDLGPRGLIRKHIIL